LEVFLLQIASFVFIITLYFNIIFNHVKMLETPVLLLIFNRPSKTSKVFESIRSAKPTRLYIAADGPRKTKEHEFEICQQTRNIVLKGIDWECEVKTLFREENLGCKIAVSEAITWFFQNEEKGIILEDDCLPDLSFFNFCSELLVKYEDDNRIMHITGSNFINDKLQLDHSYYFSRFPNIWGWATWKRAWKKYDASMSTFSSFLGEGGFDNIFSDSIMADFFFHFSRIVHSGSFNTWDLQWVYCVLTNNGLCVVPNINLVANIGFDNEATHTKGKNIEVEQRFIDKMNSVDHPLFIYPNQKADLVYFDLIHNGKYLRKRKTIQGRITTFLRKVRFKSLQIIGLKPY